jgi:hypothetical protein
MYLTNKQWKGGKFYMALISLNVFILSHYLFGALAMWRILNCKWLLLGMSNNCCSVFWQWVLLMRLTNAAFILFVPGTPSSPNKILDYPYFYLEIWSFAWYSYCWVYFTHFAELSMGMFTDMNDALQCWDVSYHFLLTILYFLLSYHSNIESFLVILNRSVIF